MNETFHSLFPTYFHFRYREGKLLIYFAINDTLAVLGLIANTLCIIAVLSSSKRSKPHMKLVLNLAVADAVMAGIMVTWPEEIANYCWDRGVIADTTYDVMVTVRYVLLTVSFSWALCAVFTISFNQFLAVTRPLQYTTTVTSRRLNGVICFQLLTSFLIAVTPIVVGFVKRIKNGSDELFSVLVISHHFILEYTFLVLGVSFFAVLIYIYIKIWLEIRKNHSARGQDVLSNKKAVVTSLIIVVTFWPGWVPLIPEQNVTPQLTSSSDARSDAMFHFNFIRFLFLLLNTVLDPVIHGTRLGDVQEGYRNLFGKCCRVCTLETDNIESENTEYNSHLNTSAPLRTSIGHIY